MSFEKRFHVPHNRAAHVVHETYLVHKVLRRPGFETMMTGRKNASTTLRLGVIVRQFIQPSSSLELTES